MRKGRITGVKKNNDWHTTNDIVADYVLRQEVKHKKLMRKFEESRRRIPLRALQTQAGFLSLNFLLGLTCLLMIATEGFFISRFVDFQPRLLLANFQTPKTVSYALTEARDYLHYFRAETNEAILDLGTDILSDLGEIKGFSNHFKSETQKTYVKTKAEISNDAVAVISLASHAGSQIENLAINFWADIKAPYLAGGNVIISSFNEQKNQGKSLAVNVWNGLVGNVGLLDKYARNEFDYGNNFAFVIPSDPPAGGESRNPLSVDVRQSRDPLSSFESHLRDSSPGARNDSRGSVLGETAVDPNYINQLIDSRLNQYLSEGKFKGEKGGKGDIGAQGPAGAGSTLQGGWSIGYVNLGNPGGQGNGTIGSFTYFSSDNSAINILNSQTVNVSGNTALAGTLSAATSTLSRLTVSGAATFSGSTTIAGLTVTGLNPGLTQGSVLFQGASNILEDNANFFWDDSNNRLGVGTNSPASKLDVYGNLTVGTSSTPTLFVNTATGNVGIGTAVPGAKLQVGDGSGNVFSLVRGTSSQLYIGTSGNTRFGFTAGQTGLVMEASSDVPLTVGTFSGQPLVLGTNNTEWVRLTSTGNVGIGTTTPSGVMHVVGQCVMGDTRLRRRKRRKIRKSDGSDEYIEEWEEVRIDQIQAGDEILSMEPDGGFTWSRVKALQDMGQQETYKLITRSGKAIRTTGNHPYFALKIAGNFTG